MRSHAKQFSQFEYNRTAEWLAVKEKGLTDEAVNRFNRKWSARYRELVSQHYRQAKTLFDELQRMHQEQGRIDDIIAAQREAEEYIRITFYENKQESTRTVEQASDDEVRRNTIDSETSSRRNEFERALDEKREAVDTMKEELERILKDQKNKGKRL